MPLNENIKCSYRSVPVFISAVYPETCSLAPSPMQQGFFTAAILTFNNTVDTGVNNDN